MPKNDGKVKQITKINDLEFDHQNANRGTPRGAEMIEKSLQDLGAGRSIVVDADGDTIAGNKTLRAARALGMEIEVVQTTGDKLIVVQRTDLDLDSSDDKRARRLAYADNRTSEVGIDWDPQQIADDLAAGIDLGTFFKPKELEKMIPKAEDAEELGEEVISPELFERHDYVVFYVDNEFDWQVIIEALDIKPVLGAKVGNKTIMQKGLGRLLPAAKLLKLIQNAQL